jgi:SPP1 family phage portal protein
LFYIDKNVEITTEHIKKYIEIFKSQYLPKLKTNKAYYDVLNPTISNRVMTDETKSNVKIQTPWARMIVSLISNFFMGTGVKYSIPNEELSALILANNNEELSHNQLLEKDCSIYGIAYELLYLNDNKQLKYTKLNPQQIIPIYSNSIDGELLYVIRFWDEEDILTNNSIMNVELYSKNDIKIFKSINGALELLETKLHYFQSVPVIPYWNNEDLTGDTECVHKLIDGYDLSLSDTANFRAELNDSYLVIYNSSLEDSDILKMKSNRIFSVESADTGSNAKIEWLTKDTNDTENENYKNRLAEDIAKFSYISDLETVSKSHISAESVKMGLMSISQLCSEKSTYFRKALLKRLEMICNIYNLFGNDFDITDVKIQFIPNIPQNISSVATTINLLKDVISRKSAISMLPFIDNVNEELAQIEEEQKHNYSNEKTEKIEQSNNQII